jgi:hypothetical protein
MKFPTPATAKGASDMGDPLYIWEFSIGFNRKDWMRLTVSKNYPPFPSWEWTIRRPFKIRRERLEE